MTDDGRAADDLPLLEPKKPGQAPAGPTRRAVLWSAAEARGVPLRAILTTIAAVVNVKSAAKSAAWRKLAVRKILV